MFGKSMFSAELLIDISLGRFSLKKTSPVFDMLILLKTIFSSCLKIFSYNCAKLCDFSKTDAQRIHLERIHFYLPVID